MPSEPQSFYESLGSSRYRSTELTRGPWDADSQHAGPPAALLGYAIEALPDAEAFRVGRLTYEILRPVPIAELEASARVVRPGRRVQMIEAALTGPDGEVMIARGWRIRTAETDVSGAVLPPAETLPPADETADNAFFPGTGDVGYHTATEYRFIEGAFTAQGPAKVWMRQRYPLVAGEEPTPLQRVLVVADSGNGVSATLDFRRFIFINVDLTVHLDRLPEGEWIGLDAVTLPQPDGTGSSDTVLHDTRGRIGRTQQTLLVAERS